MSITRTSHPDTWPLLLRVQEVAILCDVSEGLVFEMCRRQQLPHQKFGRLIRVPKSAVLALLGSPSAGDTP